MELPSPVVGDQFGSSCAGIGDVDGDGRADFVVSVCAWATDVEPTEPSQTGVACFSGRDGRLIWTGAPGVHFMRFGKHQLRPMPDLDGDGRTDIAAFGWKEQGQMGAYWMPIPEVTLVSGKSGATLCSSTVGRPGDRGTMAVVSDVDTDGWPEVVIALESVHFDEERLQLLSLGRGTMLSVPEIPAPFRLSVSCLAALADHDGDGFSDVLVKLCPDRPGATPPESQGDVLQMLSGRSLVEIARVELPNDWRPGQFCVAGDVDGDGGCDVFVGGLGRPDPCRCEARAYSLRDGSEIVRIQGRSPMPKGGSIGSAGDVDGDGCADLLFAEYHVMEGGLVSLISGNLRSPLHLIEFRYRDDNRWSEYFGYALASIGDVDADGTPDWAITQCTPWGDERPRLTVWSGRTRKLLFAVDRTSLAASARGR